MAHARERLRARLLILLTALALAGMILWAAFAELDQISRAGGQVIPTGRVQVLQSADGGTIAEIRVQEGKHVHKGEVLVVLDRVRIEAAVDESRGKVAALKATRARIEAELFDRTLAFPKEVLAFPEFVTSQTELYEKRRAAQVQDIAALRRMLGLVKQELEMNRPLVAYGDVSRSELLRMERSVADIEGQIAARQNKYLQDLQTEYARTTEELASTEQMLTQREASLSETEIRSPVDGVVKNIRLTTVGGVLRPGDEVLQLVPTGDELIVEAKVSPSDIAYVRKGQSASVKFDAYDSSIFGSANGEVIYVSPDTLAEQKGATEQIFYRVHVKVDTAPMRDRSIKPVEIQPGMTATTEIKTGRNTVLKYLLKPLVKTLGNSMGEH